MSLFIGSIAVVKSEYYSDVTRYNIKAYNKLMDEAVSESKEIGIKDWFASKLMLILIIVIIVLIVGGFINLGIVRIISMAVLTVSFVCSFALVSKSVSPGLSFLVLLIGIIVGFCSCAEPNKAVNDRNIVYKEYNLSSDIKTSTTDSWKCAECGRENPKYLTTCKCGTSKADSERKSN